MILPPAQALAIALADALVNARVKDVIVCPGSRSQAFALEFARRESKHELNLHVRVDEREAGFLALGIAKASNRPVAVVTTSGSAVANLLPATLEAHHALIPLILITADRPPELKDRAANQTTAQDELLSPAVREVLSAAAPEQALAAVLVGHQLGVHAVASATAAANPGPVQINIGLREPLSATVTQEALDEVRSIVDTSTIQNHVLRGDAAEQINTGNAALSLLGPVELAQVPTLVIAGMPLGTDGLGGTRAAEVAEQLQAPLFAEIVSSAGASVQAVHQFRTALATEQGKNLAAQIEQIVVFGKPSLYRETEQLVRRPGVRVIVVQPAGDEWYRPRDDAIRASDVIVTGTVPNSVTTWHQIVQSQRRIAAVTAQEVTAQEVTVQEVTAQGMSKALVRAVANATGSDDAIMFGASSLVRVAGNTLERGFTNVFANRGLAGIDGTISTAIGVACAWQRGHRSAMTRLIIGDITYLYDVAGLWLAQGEPTPNLQIIVGNDRGGSIFAGLEVAAADPALFTRVMKTPHNTKLAELAAAYGWQHQRVVSGEQLEAALRGGPAVIEVTL